MVIFLPSILEVRGSNSESLSCEGDDLMIGFWPNPFHPWDDVSPRVDYPLLLAHGNGSTYVTIKKRLVVLTSFANMFTFSDVMVSTWVQLEQSWVH